MLNSYNFIKLFSPDLTSGNKPVLYIIFLFLFFTTVAQENLVMNPSFEEYWSCPTSNDLNDGQFEKCKHWWKPTMGTSDYFNRCNNGVVSVPNNFWGYQEPYDGDGYIGFVPIEFDINSIHVGSEYVRTKLKSPLKQCYEYRFTMYVSLSNLSTHGIGKLGVLFSQEGESINTWLSINEIPQIENHDSILSDTINWTKIEGTFIANGFETFMTIGYFHDNVFQDTNFIQDFGFGSWSYYYLDRISLYELGSISNEICQASEVSFPNVFTPNSDGVNDTWEFKSPVEGELQILNRWGNVIYFESGTYFNFKEVGLTDGVYFYIFKYEQNLKTGFIHLVR